MARHRKRLPQLGDPLFLTDGGIETVLVFHEGIELPHFAAFPLLRSADGRETLRRYYDDYVPIALAHGAGFVLESPTWRASADWGDRLGYDAPALAEANRVAVELLEAIRAKYEGDGATLVVSGCVGPRGDGYDPGRLMSPEEAERFHAAQVGTFADTAADLVTGITMTNVPEAIGLARAARTAEVPVALAFTTETDGRLPSGQTLREAVEGVDAATNGYPAYYMINCAHPTHFEGALADGGAWTRRIRGLRANASTKSHAELDAATELDTGSPFDLGDRYRALRRRHPQLTVLGGCCGTDHRHVAAIADACLGRARAIA